MAPHVYSSCEQTGIFTLFVILLGSLQGIRQQDTHPDQHHSSEGHDDETGKTQIPHAALPDCQVTEQPGGLRSCQNIRISLAKHQQHPHDHPLFAH